MTGAAKRVCLLTPGHLSTNPRLVKEADALAGAGYAVSVISADYLDWAREMDRAFETASWNQRRFVRFGPTATMSVRLRQGVRQRAARAAFRAGARGAAIETAAWHPAAPDIAAAACRVQADLYVAHYPAALPAAARAASRWGAAYAFDAEDYHPGDLPTTPEHDEERRRLDALERRYLPGCAYITAASPGIAAAYAEKHGLPAPTTILNTFPLADAPPAATPSGLHSPSLYWFSQTIGPDRGLECAVRAIGASRTKPTLFLRGHPQAGYRARLEELAAGCGVGDRLCFMAPAPPSEMARLAAQHDVGLVCETGHTENRRIAITNKLFTYMLAGVPVIASDIPAHRQLAAGLGPAMTTFPVEDPIFLAGVLDALFEAPTDLAETRAYAFRLGQTRYNWEHEREVLLTCIRGALQTSHSPARRGGT